MQRLTTKLVTLSIGFSAGLFSFPSLASYYCSTQSGRGYINTGDLMANVAQICGAPTDVKVNEAPDNRFSTTEYWVYTNTQVSKSSPLGVNQPEIRVTNSGSMVIFEIQNGSITAITENGQSVPSATNCGQSIDLGASSNLILSQCGSPNSTHIQNNPSHKMKKTTIWTYDRGQYTSPLIFEFDDEGKLQAIVD
jgi:hypothetical protein